MSFCSVKLWYATLAIHNVHKQDVDNYALFSNTEIIIIADFCLLLQIERVIDSSNKKLCH